MNPFAPPSHVRTGVPVAGSVAAQPVREPVSPYAPPSPAGPPAPGVARAGVPAPQAAAPLGAPPAVHRPGAAPFHAPVSRPQQTLGWAPGYPSPVGPPPPLVESPGTRGRARRGLSFGWAVAVVVLALVAGAVGGILAPLLLDDGRIADAGLPAAVGTGAGDRAPESVAGVAATVLPSVVSIEVVGAEGTSTGSGLVLRQDGYILTNNHVVQDGADAGATISVLFADGKEDAATIVGRTPDYDVAVLKVERTGLVPLVLGDSDDVVVGDPVIAIGAPLGLEGTVTTGIVSALNRPVSAGDATDTAFINAIQTDAAINPGNSGGPLVNAAGEVVGINSAIAQPPGAVSAAGGSIGLGFAITSNQARRTAEQLIENGVATYPIIGVLLDQAYTGEGVQVATEPSGGNPSVTPRGPADRAGIRRGDVIVAIDGRPVTEPDELIVAIRAKTPGDTVVLTVRTGTEERDVRVVLDESPRE